MSKLASALKNPYEEMYHWCKGEIYDLQALIDSTGSKENLDKQLKKLESKKNDAKEDLENVNLGKKSVRTLFKNEKDANGLQSTVESVIHNLS